MNAIHQYYIFDNLGVKKTSLFNYFLSILHQSAVHAVAVHQIREMKSSQTPLRLYSV